MENEPIKDKDRMISMIEQALKDFSNFGIVFWNLEDRVGYQFLSNYSVMSNTDTNSAMMSIDAICTMMLEKIQKERLVTN